MKQYFLVDAEGWPDYESSRVFPEGEEAEGYIHGWDEPFFKPRWEGSSWVEGATEEEIEDTLKDPEPTEEQIKVEQLNKAIAFAADKLPDEVVAEVPLIFDRWEDWIGKRLTTDRVVRYGDDLIRVVQDHDVLEHYPPSIDTAALYRIIPKPKEPGVIERWEDRWNMSPRKDGYKIGDKVIHDEDGIDYEWESKIGTGVNNDFNYFEPKSVNWTAWEKIGPA